jgi:hypothetical protein
VLAAASPAVMTWPALRVEGEPDDDRLVRRGTEEGLAPGGSAKAPAVGDELTLPAMRIGLELEATAADVGGEMSDGVGSAPELSRDRREGRREASDILVCGDAASSSARALTSTLRFSIMTYSFPRKLSSPSAEAAG